MRSTKGTKLLIAVLAVLIAAANLATAVIIVNKRNEYRREILSREYVVPVPDEILLFSVEGECKSYTSDDSAYYKLIELNMPRLEVKEISKYLMYLEESDMDGFRIEYRYRDSTDRYLFLLNGSDHTKLFKGSTEENSGFSAYGPLNTSAELVEYAESLFE